MFLKNNSECTVTSCTAEIEQETVSYLVFPTCRVWKPAPVGMQRARDKDTDNWLYKLGQLPHTFLVLNHGNLLFTF